jgi:hypothetical protein
MEKTGRSLDDSGYPQPADVVTLQRSVPDAVNPARPFRSYGGITFRETTGRAEPMQATTVTPWISLRTRASLRPTTPMPVLIGAISRL